MGSLYEQDFIGWTEQQASLLREVAVRHSELGLDWENLIEEVEGLGRTYLIALARQIRLLVANLLKLEFSSNRDLRRRWFEAAIEARAEVGAMIEGDPGLKPRMLEVCRDETPRAIKLAAHALADYGEHAAANLVRSRSPYTEDQIIGDWFPNNMYG